MALPMFPCCIAGHALWGLLLWMIELLGLEGWAVPVLPVLSCRYQGLQCLSWPVPVSNQCLVRFGRLACTSCLPLSRPVPGYERGSRKLTDLGCYFICLTKPSHTARSSFEVSREPLVVATFTEPTAKVIGFWRSM